MMSKKDRLTWDRVKTGDDAIDYAEYRNARVDRQTGSHRIVKTELGTCPVPLGELRVGTKKSIARMFMAIGISISVVLVSIYTIIGASLDIIARLQGMN